MSGPAPDPWFEPRRHWWELYAEVWAAEVAAFEAAGLVWEPLPDPGPESGTARRQGTVTLPGDSPWTRGTKAEGVEITLTIGYPSSYPWFTPSVWLRELQLPWLTRHRGVGDHLCLMHDEHWRPGMTAAGMLASQLSRLLTAAAPEAEQVLAREELAEIEMLVPEPTSLRTATTDWMVLADSAWDIPADVAAGYLLVAFAGGATSWGTLGLDGPGYAARVYDPDGAEVAGFPTTMLPSPYLPVAGRWLRLDAPPEPVRTRHLFEQLQNRLPPPLTQPVEPVGLHTLATYTRLESSAFLDETEREDILADYLRRGQDTYLRSWQRFHGMFEVIGLLHPDETTWRTSGWSWSFLLRHRLDRRRKWWTVRARTGYAGPSDLRTRAPHAAALATTTITIFGLGAIGSRVAEGLAQAGAGTLHVIDRDTLEAGNLTRHTATMRQVGHTKAGAVAAHLRDRAPLTTVDPLTLNLGATHLYPHAINVHGVVLTYIADSDLVIDAAADPAVTRYLAALCLAEATPFVHVSATAGGWGGTVVRVDPDVTPGCWSCLEHHRADGTIPAPPADPADNRLQPVGCMQPTFTGAAADLDTVALHAVRVITDQLAGADTDVELMSGDVFVASLHTPDGPVPARWEFGRLAVHPACPVHGTHAAEAAS